MAANETFKRVEKKYLLSREQYNALRRELGDRIIEDEYGLSSICNVYYDTEDYRLIRESIEKPDYKEKLRVRSYGTPKDGTKVFLELKKKYDGIVYKRRVSMPIEEARNYLENGVWPKSKVNTQILREIDYFQKMYRSTPKMYLAYDRIATYGAEDNALRITFDQNIRFRQEDIDLAMGDSGRKLLENDEVLMEIKVGGAYPLWLSEILNRLEIYPHSFSKYGNIYKKLLAEGTLKKNNIKPFVLPGVAERPAAVGF